MARISNVLAAIAASAAAFMATPSVQAADMLSVYVAVEDPICGHSSVRSTIASRFRHQVAHVPNLPNVDIVSFHDARLTRYEPALPNSPIERRYCHASVALSDGYVRPIWYLVEYGQGFASIGDNVEFCVSGFDRWNVYNRNCSVLR